MTCDEADKILTETPSRHSKNPFIKTDQQSPTTLSYQTNPSPLNQTTVMLLKRIYSLGVAASILSGVNAKPHRKLQDAYEVEVAEITLSDVDTQIPDIEAVHNGK
jgi:hypothetical protein